ncbi:ComEC/Rec2 family competence protein [Nioella aestuarii]|uniref:ComEC/Rec2 family competence protein n=1 Tax=Nioella aestuarii TaxID=1662864 RepID=UPI003D7F408D
MPWSPVFFGLGVSVYFALPVEPGPAVYGLAGAAAVLAAILGRLRRETLGPLATAGLLVALGLCAAGWRTGQVAGPVLGFRYYGPIEGRIVAVDRSASDRLRLTLDQVVLAETDPARIPHRVRVSLHGDQPFLTPHPGARVALTGHLSPPEGPAEPGGFDFQRHAWFLSIGAVGYTRSPALLLEPRPEGALPLLHLRLRLSRAVQERIDGEPGAFAAAVMTGDRSSISTDTLDTLRRTNIAHLLAISGLHMGLLTGFVFLSLRAGLSLIPPLALRVPTKKIAAVGALASGAFYLAVAGGNVATERAFIQVAVMFVAVLLDRRAVTLRSVAIAALIVLAHRPESLLGPGFQMSFAATTALVAVFNGLKRIERVRTWPAWARWMTGLVLSSVVAGLATAPFAAAHFNMLAAYGLVANLLTVPVMGSLVIPAAVVAMLLWPLGLEWVAFRVMEAGLAWILAVADHIAGMDGAVRTIVMPHPMVLPLMTLGALHVILWHGRGRWGGLGPMALALVLWTGGERPSLLISPSGRLAGAMMEEGRVLSRARGDGFVAGLWLENDGDDADQAGAATRAGWVTDGDGVALVLGDFSVWHGVGRRAAADLVRACADHDWVISPEEEAALLGPEIIPVEGLSLQIGRQLPLSGPRCGVIGPGFLAQSGAVAVIPRAGDLRLISARQLQGHRPWVPDAQ